MERSRATVFFRGRAGTTLAELMVAVAIMSIGCLGLFGAFTYISKSLFISRAQTLATNLAQEKIEVLKNATYYDLLVTTASLTDNRFTPGILYDTSNYPPETIAISGITYTRYTYVTMVDVSAGNIIAVGSNYPDTGLKQIVVNLVWTSNGAPKHWTLTNLLENPAVNPLDSTLTGTITISGGGGPLASAVVKVEQNNNWSGTTDNSGVYSFSVFHGTYTVRASSAGFYDEVSPNTLVARGGSATPAIAPLERISTGNVTGIAWYNPNLVISQVISSTVSAATGYDAEYVELFNPTTAAINIGSGATHLVNLNYGSGNNEACSSIPLVYVSTYVASGQYYLIMSTPSITLNGVAVAADAYYDSTVNHGNCSPWNGGTWNAANGWDIIQVGHSGMVWLTDSGGNTLDVVGWSNGATLPNGCSGHCSTSCNGTCVPLPSGALPAGEQLVRVSSPAATLAASGTSVYGRAYNSQNNSVDFFYPNPGVSSYLIQFPPKNVASGTFPIISGQVPSGVVVSASDMNSASITAFSTTITSGALNLPYVPFTLTGVTTGTYSVALDYTGLSPVNDYTQVISNVLVNQGQTTAIPYAGSSPAWAPPNFYQVQLSSSPDTGFVKGTVTDINNNPIASGVPVTGGGNSKLTTSSNGQYFMNVASGTISLTANGTNASGSNSSYVQEVFPVTVSAGAVTTQNFVLSLGARLTGYCTTGTTAITNQVVNAMQGGNQMGTATTDGTGVFTILNVATGTYTVQTVIGTGQSSTPTSDLFPVGSPGITATVTAVGTVFVGTFTFSGAYGSIVGNVTDNNTYMIPAGLVTSGALIIASTSAISATPPAVVASSAAALTPVYMTSSKADGSFSLPVRGAATYNLRVFVPVDSAAGVITVDSKNYPGIVVGVGGKVTQNVVIP